MFDLRSMFDKTKAQIAPEEKFWRWFARNEFRYRLRRWSPQDFLEALVVQLQPFDPWLKLLIGGDEKTRLELIVTTDGDIALFSRAFTLVQTAPDLPGWRFTALKQPMGMEGVRIEMEQREFSAGTMQFYAEEDRRFPDEVSLVFTHQGYDPKKDELFQSGGMIYLENALGELNAAVKIDRYRVGPEPTDLSRLIHLSKLPDYLLWREKEFTGRYDRLPVQLPAEKWRVIEAQDAKGKPMLATFNRGYANWPFRPAYPWLVVIDIRYEGRTDGLPHQQQWEELRQMENELLALLQASGVLTLGHKTYDSARTIYAYARDYWNISVALNNYRQKSAWPYALSFYMARDKYWQAAAGFI